MIRPHDGDEDATHRVAEPHRPEGEQRSKRGRDEAANSNTSTVIKTPKTPSENALSRSGVALPMVIVLMKNVNVQLLVHICLVVATASRGHAVVGSHTSGRVYQRGGALLTSIYSKALRQSSWLLQIGGSLYKR